MSSLLSHGPYRLFKSLRMCAHTVICIMAHDFDRQDDREGPLDIFIMALYRVDKVGGRVVYVRQYLWNKI